jgi:DnaJ family protein A protein 2
MGQLTAADIEQFRSHGFCVCRQLIPDFAVRYGSTTLLPLGLGATAGASAVVRRRCGPTPGCCRWCASPPRMEPSPPVARRRVARVLRHIAPTASPTAADPDADDLYDVLGVSRDADDAAIRKAYRRAAVKHHPDKGGDEASFQKISRAHEVLSDDEKRQIYDQFGLQGLEQHEQGEAAGGAGMGGGGGGGMDPFSMFEGLFGGGFGGGQGQGERQPRQRDQTFELNCTLNDAYNGKKYRVQFDRSILCSTCTGSGVQEGHTRESASVSCEVCGGAGQTIRTQRTLFGMQRVQSTCNACGGQGSVLDPSLLCGVCTGQGLERERHTLEVDLPRGVEEGETILMSEQGDYNIRAGRAADVVFVARVKEHPVFTRHGSHLLLTQKVSLAEALGGLQLLLSQLDGRRLLIKTGAGECLAPGALRVVEGEGMPRRDGASPAALPFPPRVSLGLT